MNMLAGSGLVALAAGLLYVFAEPQPADVYNIPMPQVYAKLTSTDLGESSSPDHINLNTDISGNGRDKVFWTQSRSHSDRECKLQLAPFEGDAERTHITITCFGGATGDGAASGIAHNLARNVMIERVDAILTDREFDRDRAGATSARWPGDGVDGSYDTAVNNAIEMDSEMQQEYEEYEEYDDYGE